MWDYRMIELIIATRNLHKVEEIRGILGTQFRILTLLDFPGAPAVVEDAATFAGNAAKKAMELARWIVMRGSDFKVEGSRFVIADDSGLEVDALNGAPGVHSARFAALDSGAGGNSSDAENNAKLLYLMQHVPERQRTARFRCVIALARVDSSVNGGAKTDLFDGACEGRITRLPSGAGGFGYDPLFVPNGFTQSFAELGAEVKNSISHRAQALAKLCAHLAVQ